MQNADLQSKKTTSLRTIISQRQMMLVVSALLSTIGAGAGLMPYYLMYRIATEIVGQTAVNPQTIWSLAIGAVVAVIVKAICMTASTHLSHTAAYSILYDTRLTLARKMGTLPLGYFNDHATGTIKKVIHEDVENLEEGLAHMIPDMVSGLAAPLITLVILALVDWRMALATGVMIPITLVIFAIMMGGGVRRMMTDFNELMAKMNAVVIQYVNGMRVIKAFTRTDASFAKLREAANDTYDFYQSFTVHVARRYPVVTTLIRANLLTIIPFGLLFYLSGTLSIPTLILFLLMGMGLTQYLFKVYWHGGIVYYQVGEAIKRVNALLNETSIPETTAPRQPDGYTLEFKGVEFGYNAETQVLKGVDCIIPAGTMTALVGESGAGKSTIAKLIPRFWDVTGGSIMLGGVDIRSISTETLMNHIAFVFQDVFLFNDTIYENIRIGKPNATKEEILQAATQARVDDFVQELEGGYEYLVGENGSKLSGGQRQRISIARAILKDAPIIVLDEATAFVDPENESLIQSALAALMPGGEGKAKTLVVVAHRLSTITEADQILVVDDGKIIAQGKHPQLLGSSDMYRTLWDAHIDAQNWQFDNNVADVMTKLNINRNATYDNAAAALPQTYENLNPNAPIIGLLLNLLGALRSEYMWAVLWHILSGIFIAAPSLVVYLVLVELLTGTIRAEHVWISLGALVAIYTFQYFFSALGYGTLLKVDAGMQRNLRLYLADYMRRLPMGFFTRRDIGTIDALFTTNIMFLETRLPTELIILTAIIPTMVFVTMIFNDWRLALAAVAGFPIAFWVLGRVVKIFDRVWVKQSHARTRANARMVEYIQGISVIRAFNLAGERLEKFQNSLDDYRQASIQTTTSLSPAMTAFVMVAELGLAGVIVVGSSLYLNGSLRVETFLLFMFLSLAFYAPVINLGDMLSFNRIVRNSARNINEFLKTPLLHEPAISQKPNGFDIAFEDVHFGYDGKMVLNGVSFEIPERNMVALVGPSGSGKTTVTSLIARFWDIDSGSIKVGGVDVRDMTANALLANITMVFQDVYLFNDTVINNIKFGNPSASDEQVFAAARAAQCHDFIVEMPEGYQSVIGEGGSTLSGGQKQRISIARAILKDAPIVLLDEATASIDPENERLIQQAFNALTANKTLIVIAHRLNTVQYADKIIVLSENGQVAQQGTHSALIAQSGQYRRFWEERQRAGSWKLGRTGEDAFESA